MQYAETIAHQFARSLIFRQCRRINLSAQNQLMIPEKSVYKLQWQYINRIFSRKIQKLLRK